MLRQVGHVSGKQLVQRDGALLDVAGTVEPEQHHGLVRFDPPEQRDAGVGVLDRLQPTVETLRALGHDLDRERDGLRRLRGAGSTIDR